MSKGTPFRIFSGAIKDDSGRRIPLGVYVPDNLRTEQPDVVVNGWGVGRNALDVPAGYFIDQGAPVITFDHLRSGVDANPRGQKSETVAAVARAAIEMFGRKPHMRAYSEGGIHASYVAATEPDLVDRITLYKAFGLDPTTALGLMHRVEKEAKQLPKPCAALARAAFFGALYASNLGLTVREVVALARVDISEDLQRAVENGVPVAGVFAERDQISPALTSARKLGSLGINSLVLPNHGHLGFLYDRQVAAAGDNMGEGRTPGQQQGGRAA